MLLQNLLSTISLSSGLRQYDIASDSIDRLNGIYTAAMLTAMAILTSFKMFGGTKSAIECGMPDDFPSSWEEVGCIYLLLI